MRIATYKKRRSLASDPRHVVSDVDPRRFGGERKRVLRNIRQRQSAGGEALTSIDETIAQCEALDEETERLQAAARRARAAYGRGEYT
jgi:hypothetical protein